MGVGLWANRRDRSAEWKRWRKHYRLKYPEMTKRKTETLVCRRMYRVAP